MRENAPEGVLGRGQELLPGNRQSPPRSGEATQETSENGVKEQLDVKDSFGGTQDKIIIIPAPERKPPDENFDREDTRIPATQDHVESEEGEGNRRTNPRVWLGAGTESKVDERQWMESPHGRPGVAEQAA